MFIFVFVLFLLSVAKLTPTVSISQGTFLGKTVSKTNMYLGIPYALPPTGPLRFRPPQPILESSNSTFDATEYGLACIPRKTASLEKYGEDCLNLDIYSPVGASNLPVIVFVFGGGFDAGNSHQRGIYNGAHIINIFPEVVIVCINHRLNVFGFLSGKEVSEEGSLNAGLLDQKMAFLWVRQNIKAFGGNPEQVTAWGHSAGSISISIHMLADQNQKLFDRAILLSGPPTLMFFPVQYHQKNLDSLVENVNCNKGNNVLQCLRKLSASELQTAGLDVPRFTPTLDNVHVVQTMNAYQQRSFSKIPVFISTSNHEGIIFTKYVDSSNLNTTTDFVNRLNELWHSLLNEEQVSEILKLYDPRNYNNNYNDAFAELFSDLVFKCPTSKLSQELQSLDVPIYQARFGHILNLLRFSRTTHKPLQSFHGSDLLFYWQTSRYLTPLEYHLAFHMTQTLLKFVKGQEPWTGYGGGWRYEIEKRRMVRDTDYYSDKCSLIFEYATELVSK